MNLTRQIVASGTTATDGTEQTLRDETSSEGKVIDALLDLGALTATETFEIRVYTKVLVGGTLRRAYYQKFVGSQDDEASGKSVIIYVPAMTATTEWKLTMKKVAGTNRNIDWKVNSD